MDIRRLCLAAAVSVGLLMSAGGCGPRGGLVGRIDAALGRAGNFLIQKQSSDGAWRSQTYGCFLSGAAITPHVMSSLFFIPQANPAAREAFDRGVDFLAGFVGEDGQLRVAERELLFPVFAASAASRVVALAEKSPRTLRAQQAWLACPSAAIRRL